MNVLGVQLRGFMSHADTVVELPKAGVVLVTGPNGSGKSSLIECVSVALWGRTLRGSAPWADGAGSAGVWTADGVTSQRIRGGGKTDLVWGKDGESTAWETTTKAQAALERLVGTWDVWRRSSVFSSSDAGHFAQAADAERKRLVEAMLGVGRFDEALAACRADLSAAERSRLEADGRVANAELRRDHAAEQLREAEHELAAAASSAEHGADASARAEVLAVAVRNAEAEVVEIQRALGAVQERRAGAGSRVAVAGSSLQLLRGDVCPTCRQPIGESLRQLEEPAAEAAQAAARAEVTSATEEIVSLRAQLVDAEDERRSASAGLTELRAQAAVVEERLRRCGRAQAVRDRSATDLAGVESRLTEARAAQAAAALESLSLGAVERVLGLRGVRAQLIARALGGVEASANRWLDALGGGLRLALRPFTERKSGAIADAVAMDVDGVPHREGYWGCSGGQRRRIDVALVLALGEVAAAARGAVPGTLFVDELFDALDADGVERAASVLTELARERAVVVVSHSDDLARMLRPARHLRVEAGAVAG